MYLRILPNTWAMIGGSPLATFLAVPLAFFARTRTSSPNMAALQGQYDRFHSDKRAIDSDEESWQVFWYEGEDVRPWPCLRAVHELRTLLVLTTETTNYWLPKAALERGGQLNAVKALAESAFKKHEMLFPVPLRPSAAVFVAARIFNHWRFQFKSFLLWYSAATLVLYWVLFSNREGALPYSPWFLCLAPALFFCCDILYQVQNYYFANWAEAAPEAEIMSDCVGYRTATVRWIGMYRRLLKCRELPGAFLLYFEPKGYYLIPKRGFSNEQILQFRKLVSTRV